MSSLNPITTPYRQSLALFFLTSFVAIISPHWFKWLTLAFFCIGYPALIYVSFNGVSSIIFSTLVWCLLTQASNCLAIWVIWVCCLFCCIYYLFILWNSLSGTLRDLFILTYTVYQSLWSYTYGPYILLLMS